MRKPRPRLERIQQFDRPQSGFLPGKIRPESRYSPTKPRPVTGKRQQKSNGNRTAGGLKDRASEAMPRRGRERVSRAATRSGRASEAMPCPRISAREARTIFPPHQSNLRPPPGSRQGARGYGHAAEAGGCPSGGRRQQAAASRAGDPSQRRAEGAAGGATCERSERIVAPAAPGSEERVGRWSLRAKPPPAAACHPRGNPRPLPHARTPERPSQACTWRLLPNTPRGPRGPRRLRSATRRARSRPPRRWG